MADFNANKMSEAESRLDKDWRAEWDYLLDDIQIRVGNLELNVANDQSSEMNARFKVMLLFPH